MSLTSFQPSFWDPQDPQEKLMQEIPMLGRLAKTVPWEDFRRLLESIFDKEGKSPVGRKHTDVIIMFKLLVLQQYLNCSDMRLEFHVRHNLCLRYFVGLGVEDSVPDAKTVWVFRRRIQQAGIAEQLFHLFNDHLKREGLAPCGGQIIDSTIIPVPKQHNRREENAAIKRGELPQGWEDNPARLRQKDQDARWTKKNQASHYGYKTSISIDATHGLIRSYEITPAKCTTVRCCLPSWMGRTQIPWSGLMQLIGAKQWRHSYRMLAMRAEFRKKGSAITQSLMRQKRGIENAPRSAAG